MKQKPFFAKFLESQIAAEVQSQVKAGAEGDGLDTACDTPAGVHNPNCPPIAVTLKYPSDWEDHGGGGIITI